jgi:hypothetical protein
LPEVSIGVLNLEVEPDKVVAQKDTLGFLRNDETLRARATLAKLVYTAVNPPVYE